MVGTLVALDVDGTLMPSSGVLSPRTVSACQAVQKRDAMDVTVCTGREWSRSRDVAEAIGSRFVLASSGAIIMERDTSRSTWKLLRKRWLDVGVALQIFDALVERFPGPDELIMNLDYDDRWYDSSTLFLELMRHRLDPL